MAVGIYTIFLATFRPPITMLGLRVGPDHNSPWVSKNAERPFVYVIMINSSNDAEESGWEQDYQNTGTQKMRQL